MTLTNHHKKRIYVGANTWTKLVFCCTNHYNDYSYLFSSAATFIAKDRSFLKNVNKSLIVDSVADIGQQDIDVKGVSRSCTNYIGRRMVTSFWTLV